MEDVELSNGGGNIEGNLYLSQLLNEGKLTPIAEIKSEDIKVPPWYDEKKFKRAQAYFYRFNHSILLSSLLGLIVVIAIETILNILICTKQSGTPKCAYRRYIRTVFHVFNFYGSTPDNGSKCLKSIIDVRERHSRSSAYSSKRNVGIINQRDMAITQFGFMGFVLVRHKKLGVRHNQEDIDAFVHFWRVIGHMLGIEDRYNLCTDSLDGTMSRVEAMMNHVVTPGMIKPPAQFDHMLGAMMEGLWCYIPIITKESFLYVTNMLAGVPGYYYTDEERLEQIAYVSKYGQSGMENRSEIEKELQGNKFSKFYSLHWWDRFVVNFVCYTCHLIYVSEIWRWYFKLNVHLALFLITWFPFLAFPKFGFRSSYVRILKNHAKPMAE